MLHFLIHNLNLIVDIQVIMLGEGFLISQSLRSTFIRLILNLVKACISTWHLELIWECLRFQRRRSTGFGM